MGSSMSAVYDRYDDYKWLCEKTGNIPVGMREGFFGDEQRIMNEINWEHNGSVYVDKNEK